MYASLMVTAIRPVLMLLDDLSNYHDTEFKILPDFEKLN